MSLELGIYLVLALVVIKINKKFPLVFLFVKGYQSYLPPQESDPIKKSIELEEKKKKDPKVTVLPLKLEIHSIAVDQSLANACPDFFLEFDFIAMLAIVSFAGFAISQAIKALAPSLIDSNFTFYMLLLLAFLMNYHIIKDTFIPLTLRDEQKFTILFTLKMFIISFVIITFFEKHFDFEFQEAAVLL